VIGRARLAGALGAVALAAGCATARPPTTDLHGKARHTGFVTMLRVDDAWHPNAEQRRRYRVGEGIGQRRGPYVPLRHKGDIAGLDGPDRVVTDQDLVTVTLKSVFVRFFKERGGAERQGEIALVISFQSGAAARQDILVYSSEGQTLGSYLDLDDLPVLGPLKLPGDGLTMRIVMIELDRVENEQNKQFIRAVASAGAGFAPHLGSALSIASPIAEFILDQNADDVVLD
jgi:hypothetical protein